MTAFPEMTELSRSDNLFLVFKSLSNRLPDEAVVLSGSTYLSKGITPYPSLIPVPSGNRMKHY
jgi:hypothetical protein